LLARNLEHRERRKTRAASAISLVTRRLIRGAHDSREYYLPRGDGKERPEHDVFIQS